MKTPSLVFLAVAEETENHLLVMFSFTNILGFFVLFFHLAAFLPFFSVFYVGSTF